jgi:hypothetical protein
MNRRHISLFAAAAVTLATAFAAGSASAIAESNDSLGVRNGASSETYTQNRALPDRAVESQSSSATVEGMSPSDESTTDDETSYLDESSNDSDEAMDSTVATPPESVTRGAIVTAPGPIVLPDEPRFTPETGDAQYGSKVAPYTYGPSANRFNDATGK